MGLNPVCREVATRQVVSEKIGRTENVFSNRGANKFLPLLENLLKIASALDVDVSELLRSSK